jgi:hypothetical protein
MQATSVSQQFLHIILQNVAVVQTAKKITAFALWKYSLSRESSHKLALDA